MKIKVSKAILSGLLAGSLVCSGCSIKRKDSNNIYQIREGHEPILFFENAFVHENDFVLLNVGDHDTIGTWFQDSKMKVLNYCDIPIGIIINSDASSLEDILNDVEYVKGLINHYHISFPIYLNIDSIISNPELTNEDKRSIILSFLEECSMNRIYAGISGLDSNLYHVKEWCGITGYDAYLIQDQKDIHYDGEYSVMKSLSGEIVARKDLEKMITEENFNQGKDIEVKEFNRLPSLITPLNVASGSAVAGLGYHFLKKKVRKKQKL